MSKADANEYRERRVRDDGLRVLNLCFILAVTLAASIMVYAYASTGQWNLPSEGQTMPLLEELRTIGQTLYEGIYSKVNDFAEWRMNLISSIKI